MAELRPASTVNWLCADPEVTASVPLITDDFLLGSHPFMSFITTFALRMLLGSNVRQQIKISKLLLKIKLLAL